MGKIKVRTIGDENLEEKEKKEQKKKAHEKKLKEKTEETPVEEVKAEEKPTEQEEKKLSEAKSASGAKKKAKFDKPKHVRSPKYQNLLSQVDKKQTLSISQAIELLEKLQRHTFDETVELHLNTKGEKVSAQTSLPHGTGKSLRVAIASDALLTEIESGKINFDILLAHPSTMPKLAKVAKVLGPRGLMPNPKNGTITNNPEETAKKYEGGLTYIKTEAKAPLIHIAIGKVSFGPKKLEENIDAILSAVKRENIQNAFLKSTMSPAIKLSL